MLFEEQSQAIEEQSQASQESQAIEEQSQAIEDPIFSFNHNINGYDHNKETLNTISQIVTQLLIKVDQQNQKIQIMHEQILQYQNQSKIQAQLLENNLMHHFETKIQYDRSKDLQIDKLHNELQKYKSDLILKATKPVYIGLIRIFDEISKKIDILLSTNESNQLDMITELEVIKTDILYLLEENDIFSYHMDSIHFIPDFQTITKRIPTNDLDLIGKIQKISLPGFKLNQQILIKERVYVYSQGISI